MIIDINDQNWHIYLYDDNEIIHVHFINEQTQEKVEIQNSHLLLKGILKDIKNEAESL